MEYGRRWVGVSETLVKGQQDAFVQVGNGGMEIDGITWSEKGHPRPLIGRLWDEGVVEDGIENKHGKFDIWYTNYE